MAITADKQSLRLQLDASRHQLEADIHALQQDVAVVPKVKASVARHPGGWFGAAAVVGLLCSLIPSSRPKVVVKRSGTSKQQTEAGIAALSLAALKIALNFAKPAFTKWAQLKVKRAARTRA